MSGTTVMIVAILSGIGLSAVYLVAEYNRWRKHVAAKQEIGAIMHALKLYRRDNGRYPTQEQGLRALIEKPSTNPVPNIWKDGGYLERLPNDPWGNAYQYLNPGVHSEIDVSSYGADTKQGGEGNDADIGSWQ